MPIEISGKKLYSTGEVADIIGRSRDTILRWNRAVETFPDVARDELGNRVFTEEDIEKLKVIRDEMRKKRLLRGVK